MIHLKSPEELIMMREAGRVAARALNAMREAVRPGVTTQELDDIAMNVLRKHNAIPTFLGYPPGSKHPFPAAINASINQELVHGIPSKDRVLKEGDIISLDVGATYNGFVGDNACTVPVGKISAEAQRLIEVTETSLKVGIAASRVGNETKHVSMAIQQYVESQGFVVVREYTGHGVGRKMHEDPQVPNWWPPRQKNRGWRSFPLKPGMTYALEPMVIVGHPETYVLSDHWTVVTKDGSLCAHTEHTIAVTDGEPLILTLL